MSIPRILAVLIIVGVILALVPMEETIRRWVVIITKGTSTATTRAPSEETIRRWVVIITVILAVLCLLSLLFGGVF